MVDKNYNIDTLKNLKFKIIELESDFREKLSTINKNIVDIDVLGEWQGSDFYHFEEMFLTVKKEINIQLNYIDEEMIPFLEKKIIQLDD